MAEELLVLDRLASGDRPSLYIAGMAAAQALKASGCAVLMTDVLGRVHLLPSEFVDVKRRPRLSDEDLNALSEDDALQLLVKQGDDEESIMNYLKRRAVNPDMVEKT